MNFTQNNISVSSKEKNPERLCIGNIPKEKSSTEVLEKLKELTYGIKDFYYDNGEHRDSGIAFVSYQTHVMAKNSHTALIRMSTKIWSGAKLSIKWAWKENSVDENVMNQVIFALNLTFTRYILQNNPFVPFIISGAKKLNE